MRSVLLGLPFDNLSMEEVIAEVDSLVNRRSSQQWCTANLDFAMRATQDWEFRETLRQSERVWCDSQPIKLLARFLGRPLKERVTGADLTREILNRAGQKGWKVYLLGTTESVLQECRRKAGPAVVGYYSPPHQPLEVWNHERVTSQIRASGADILLVALGSPKQDIWLRAFRSSLQMPLMMGVGASLEYYAGAFGRAPRLWQLLGAEWIYRLCQEPTRLLRRYWNDARFLLANCWFQWASHRRYGESLWSDYERGWNQEQEPMGCCYRARFCVFPAAEPWQVVVTENRTAIRGELTAKRLTEVDKAPFPLDLSRLQRADLAGRLWIRRQQDLGRVARLPDWWNHA